MKRVTYVLLAMLVFFAVMPVVNAESHLQFAIEPQFEDVKNFQNGFAGVELDGKWGIIDKTGKIIAEPQYEYTGIIDLFKRAYQYYDGRALVKKDGKYGFIDENGEEIIKPQYDDARSFSQGRAAVSIDGGWGFIDQHGNTISELKYSHRSDEDYYFSEGLAKVTVNISTGMFAQLVHGYIDLAGNEVIKPQFHQAYDFSEGLALVNSKNEWFFIDRMGDKVISLPYETVSSFKDGLAAVYKDGKYGFVDKSGKEVIGLQYDNYIHNDTPGLISVEKAGKWGLIDSSGRVILEPQFSSRLYFKNNLAIVYDCSERCTPYMIDSSGNVVISPIRKEQSGGTWRFTLSSFSEGLALVEGEFQYSDRSLRNSIKSGYVNRNGEYVIPLQLEYSKGFNEGLAAVRVGGKWGFIANPLPHSERVLEIAPILKVEPIKELPMKASKATPTSSKVLVDGKEVSFQAYLIQDNNYFKLRDLAMVLNGTEKSFEVGWDSVNNAISLESAKEYTAVGGEMVVSEKPLTEEGKLSTSIIYFDGEEVELIAYLINGNNYFKLRDVATIIDFGVTWDVETNTVGIDSSTGYVPE